MTVTGGRTSISLSRLDKSLQIFYGRVLRMNWGVQCDWGTKRLCVYGNSTKNMLCPSFTQLTQQMHVHQDQQLEVVALIWLWVARNNKNATSVLSQVSCHSKSTKCHKWKWKWDKLDPVWLQYGFGMMCSCVICESCAQHLHLISL